MVSGSLRAVFVKRRRGSATRRVVSGDVSAARGDMARCILEDAGITSGGARRPGPSRLGQVG
jgi:hypothetical protein